MKKRVGILVALLLLSACQETSKKIEKSVECQEPKVQTTKQPSQKYSVQYEECMRLGPPNECIDIELKLQDRELNNAYKEAKKSLPPKLAKKLKEVQKEWIRYRDVKCGFFHNEISGSGGLTDAMLCELDMTIERTAELKELY